MLIEQVRKTINEHNLIRKGQHIVLGLSGGPDSVCLFHVLMRLSVQMDLTIHPVHLNHKFRPGAAEHDQMYTEQLCRRNGVECRVFTVDCAAMASELSITGEEAGRIARYDAFHQTASDIVRRLKDSGMSAEDAEDAVSIAVAHNANDQAETILFRLLRGTGTDGIAGIAYERSDRGFRIIRPLMDVFRKDIEEYCEKQHLDPVTDHTNNEAVYARNRIRLELIPFLEENYNSNIQHGLIRMGRIAAEDKDYLWSRAEALFRENAKIRTDADRKTVTMEREILAAAHPAVRHRVMMKAFAEAGLEKDISEERIRSADVLIGKKQAPKTVQFPHGYRLKVAKGKVMFFKD